MKNHYARSARIVFAASQIVSLLSIAIVAIYSDVANGECPGSPTSYPNGVIEGRVSPSSQRGQECAVAMDNQGRFVAVWLRTGLGIESEIRVLRFDASGEPVCDGDPKVISGDAGVHTPFHSLPSIAITPSGGVTVAWQGSSTEVGSTATKILASSFDYDDPPSTWPVIQPPNMNDRKDRGASVALPQRATARSLG
jgi:hypothetical protein